MSEHRLWIVEEVPANDNYTGHRQTLGSYYLDEFSSWHWVRPDDKLNESQREEWDRIMDKLRDVNGEDLRHLTCFQGLLEHCLGQNTTIYK